MHTKQKYILSHPNAISQHSFQHRAVRYSHTASSKPSILWQAVQDTQGCTRELLHLLCHTLPPPSLVHSDKALSLCINSRSTDFGWNVHTWRQKELLLQRGSSPKFWETCWLVFSHWLLTALLCSEDQPGHQGHRSCRKDRWD